MHPLEIRKDGVERLALFGSSSGQRPAHVARRHTRKHRVALGPRQIVRNPLHERVAVAAEIGGIHN